MSKPKVTQRGSKKPRSCGPGNIWHPMLDKCMTLQQYMDFEEFYGEPIRGEKPINASPPTGADAAVKQESMKRKSQQ